MEFHHIIQHLVDESLRVRSGEKEALLSLFEIRMLEKQLSQLKSEIDPLAFEEAEKHPGKTFEDGHGNRWTKSEGRRTFKYPGNLVIEALKDRMRPIEDEIELEQERAKKARERMDKMQAEVIDGQVVMDGGVLVTPAVVEYSKATLTLAK